MAFFPGSGLIPFKKNVIVFILQTYFYMAKLQIGSLPLTKVTVYFIAACLALSGSAVSAKTVSGALRAAPTFAAAAASPAQLNQAIRNFESLYAPFFQAKAGTIPVPGTGLAIPSQADLFSLAKYWNLFSTSFRTLYTKATEIPAGMKKYVSPGGHFEVYYARSGNDSLDPTDTIGYGSQSWRSRQHSPNGIPDYVDEVAFAADSAWSMEIQRFGFVKPLAYTDNNYPSSNYKIDITNFYPDDQDYAFTYFQYANTTGTIGVPSHINIRTEWDSPNFNKANLDYARHPEKAIYVTLVHEFFHAIQYSSARAVRSIDDKNLFLDDFPVTWTEGVAVLMEDLGFDYINDYWQYMPDFFSRPDSSTFMYKADSYKDMYKNGLAAQYLFYHAADTPGIGFFRTMYDNNYTALTRFDENVYRTAAAFNRTWPEMLGSFNAASYYTGSRTVGSRFVPDADSFPQWSYAVDDAGQRLSLMKAVRPFAMQTFSHVNQHGNSDTLHIDFSGDTLVPAGTEAYGVWNVRCILKKNDSAADDSLIAFPLPSRGSGTLVVAGWHRFTEALVIATNGRYDRIRQATVTFETCGITILKGATRLYGAPIPDSGQRPPYALLTVNALTNLACSLSIAVTDPGPAAKKSALQDSLIGTGTYYEVSFPPSWQYNASMRLLIAEPMAAVQAIAAAYKCSDSVFYMFRWDSGSLRWSKCLPVTWSSRDSIYRWQCAVNVPGIYAVFAQLFTPDSSGLPFVAFPNPVHMRGGGTCNFQGNSLVELWIYSIDGTLVSHALRGSGASPSIAETRDGFEWRLISSSGKRVAPGIFYAYVGYKDEKTKGMRKKSQKLFVLP
jgi:hypothetical protein